MEGLGRILRTQGADETKTERPKLFGESTWERTALSYQIGHNLLIQRLCILIGVCLGYALYRSSPVGDATFLPNQSVYRYSGALFRRQCCARRMRQFIRRQMTTDGMVGIDPAQRWLLLFADCTDFALAAGVEDATGGRIDDARYFATKTYAPARLMVDGGDRR